jgi:transcriptional regulator with XRE-family HTH domain
MNSKSSGTVAKRIRALRVERSISRAQLARDLEVSERTIAFWEDGERIPSMAMVRRLSEFSGKPFAYFNGSEAA